MDWLRLYKIFKIVDSGFFHDFFHNLLLRTLQLFHSLAEVCVDAVIAVE